MGILDKLAFWKKKDDFSDLGKDLGMGEDFGKDMGMDFGGPSPDLGMGLDAGPSGPGSMQQQPFQKYPSFQQTPSFNPPAYSPPVAQPATAPYGDGYINTKNLEVISSKIDALKASLDSINQRLANIEAIARGEQEDQRKRRYY